MSVFISGPVSWNRLVLLDRLPDPSPHTVFAEKTWETVGGTSAGKAIGLTQLGRNTVVATQLADDREGALLRSLLDEVGVDLLARRSPVTERHLNLMTPRGERISIYLQQPEASEEGSDDAALATVMARAEALVLDLSPESRRLLPVARQTGQPIWVDLHDYDGSAAFHQPFLEAADAVFVNADATDDPQDLLERCLRFGAEFAVCTLGADGAVALDTGGVVHRVPATPVPVVDTNGAGDAFFAGALDARLGGADLPAMLQAAADHAAVALGTRHLHPALEALLADR